jgi:enoyl-CoA hydratase/carnithine racemase
MEGKQFGVDKAKSLGLVHDTAENEQELLEKAIAWVKANPPSTKAAQQPFDVKGYKIRVAVQALLRLHKCLRLLLQCYVTKPKVATLLLKQSWRLQLKVRKSM